MGRKMARQKRLSNLQKSVLKTLWNWEHRNVLPYPEKRGDRKKINELIIRRFFALSPSALITDPMRVSVSRCQRTLHGSGLIEPSHYAIQLTQAGRKMAKALSEPNLEKLKAIHWPSGWTLHPADVDHSNGGSVKLEILDSGIAIGRLTFY
jgi:hypothetical protein